MPLAAGEEVLAADPYCAVLHDDQRPRRCDHTFAEAGGSGGGDVGGLLRCARSKVARYCSRQAQAAAWHAGYREECAALVGCAPRVPPPTVRLAARALWRRQREQQEQQQRASGGGDMTGGGVDKKGEGSRAHAEAADASAAAAAAALGLGDGYDAVDTLEHHWEETPPARKAQLAQMAMLTCGFMAGILSSANDGGGGAGDVPSGTDADADVAATDATDAPDAAAGDAADANPAGTEAAGAKAAGTEDADPLSGGPDPRDVAKLLARFSCNLHTVCDEELKPLGIACYPAASMLNHSCRPTCAQTFVGKKVVFRCPQTPLTLNPTQTLIHKS